MQQRNILNKFSLFVKLLKLSWSSVLWNMYFTIYFEDVHKVQDENHFDVYENKFENHETIWFIYLKQK